MSVRWVVLAAVCAGSLCGMAAEVTLDASVGEPGWSCGCNAWTVDDFPTQTSAEIVAEAGGTLLLTPLAQEVAGIDADACLPDVQTASLLVKLGASSTTVATAEAVPLAASVSTDPTLPLTFTWDFDGDGFSDAVQTAPVAVFSYPSAGGYAPTVTACDPEGRCGSAALELRVIDTAPQAAFDVVSPPVAGEPVSFADVSQTPGASVAHVGWDFGDGHVSASGPSEDRLYVHEYQAAGSYTVTLYVIDSRGQLGRASATLLIRSG
ncbi:MAG: PKD domain-containing protein [Candidatus Bipolaricaulota bacterium]